MQLQCAIDLWFWSFSVKDNFQSAVIISGLVTFVAAYHHMHIFNSWVEAYSFPEASQSMTVSPFNDAYRYMDWLLSVPLLLLEILLVMDLNLAGRHTICAGFCPSPTWCLVSRTSGCG